MKKIIILISGKLKYLSDQNFLRIKDSLKDFEVNFILTPWALEDENLIKKFEYNYHPLIIKKINPTKYDDYINQIKFPDNAGSMEGFFYNWDGICKGYEEIINYCNKKNYIPDYILRYRSDILPENNSIFNLKNNLKNNQIVVPDRFHWNGINDQIFLTNFNTIKNFENFFSYIETHISQNRFFSGEYIFYRFLKKNNFKVFFNNFGYNLMREKNFKKDKLPKQIKSKIPMRDHLEIKLNKIKYKFRNFNDFFVLKKKRNKYQDIKID